MSGSEHSRKSQHRATARFTRSNEQAEGRSPEPHSAREDDEMDDEGKFYRSEVDLLRRNLEALAANNVSARHEATAAVRNSRDREVKMLRAAVDDA